MCEFHCVKNRIQGLLVKIEKLKLEYNFDFLKKKINTLNLKLKRNDKLFFSKNIYHIVKERSFLKKKIQKIELLIFDFQEMYNFFLLSLKTNDKKILYDVFLESNKIEKRIKKLKFEPFFSSKNDILNCFVTLQSGSGGIDSQDWTKMLFRMYLKWSELKKFNIDVTEFSVGDVIGLKSATIKVVSKYAYGWFRTETGIHRLVRKSPFDSTGKRHTSFSSVFVYPEIQNDIDIEINPLDLRIDVYRSSGSGGQHVNKTESAVRIKHIPTGVMVQCQNNRSQHKNKIQAIKQLKSKLYALELNKKNLNKKKLEKSKSNISWGNQIRSYILDRSRIKDLRTGIESRNIQSILNGNIDNFVLASLKAGL